MSGFKYHNFLRRRSEQFSNLEHVVKLAYLKERNELSKSPITNWPTLRQTSLTTDHLRSRPIRSLVKSKSHNEFISGSEEELNLCEVLQDITMVKDSKSSESIKPFNNNDMKKSENVINDASIDEMECDVSSNSNYIQPIENSTRTSYFAHIILFALSFLTLGVVYTYFNGNLSQTCVIDNQKFNNFSNAFQSYLIGQKAASEVIISSLKNFIFSNNQNYIMLFDGWTGSGKTYSSEIIRQYLFSGNGKLLIPSLFISSGVDLTDNETKSLRSQILSNATKCDKHSLIVIDEITTSPVVLKFLQTFLHSLKHGNKVHQGKILVILIGNTLSPYINKVLFNHVSAAMEYTEPNYVQYRNVPYAYEGSWVGEYLKMGLIDSFVPYIPLDVNKVKQCIIRDLMKKGRQSKITLVNKVLENLEFFSLTEEFTFSVTGCKRVSDKVDIVLDK